MFSSDAFTGLPDLATKFARFGGSRTAVLVVMTIVAALTEGVGLLLIIPLLGFAGAGTDGDSEITMEISKIAASIGVPLTLEVVLIAFVALVVSRQALLYGTATINAAVRVDFVADIRKTFFRTLGQLDWRVLDQKWRDEFAHVLLTDCWRIGDAAMHLVRAGTGCVLLGINLLVAILISPILAAITFTSIIFAAVAFGSRLQEVHAQGADISKHTAAAYRQVEDLIDNVRAAKMAGVAGKMQQAFDETLDMVSRELGGFVRHTEAVRAGMQAGSAVVIAIVAFLALQYFDASGGELLLFIFIVARFVPQIAAINQDLHRLSNDLPAFENAQKLIGESVTHLDSGISCAECPIPSQFIALKQIQVSRDNRPILRSIDLTVKVGEMVAIAGPSGLGKTTLMDVLAGLLEPEAGSVEIDGRPLVRNQIAAWRQQVGYVAQSAALLHDTLHENICWLSDPEPSDDDIARVLNVVNFNDVIGRLELGLSTLVDRRDGSLSGGERQRVAIARELLRAPSLLILDEATNALDVDAEEALLRAVRETYKDLTVVLVAHRDSALGMADRIVDIRDINHVSARV